MILVNFPNLILKDPGISYPSDGILFNNKKRMAY